MEINIELTPTSIGELDDGFGQDLTNNIQRLVEYEIKLANLQTAKDTLQSLTMFNNLLENWKDGYQPLINHWKEIVEMLEKGIGERPTMRFTV